MILKDILANCSTLSVYEERSATEEYYELVFYSKDVEEWEGKLAEAMGGVAKPAGAKPTREQLAATQDLGGLWVDQTLFIGEKDGTSVIAMFWPWQDKTHVTLKLMAQKS